MSVTDADLVVENVTENRAIKEPLYRHLDAVCKTGSFFGVNSSTIAREHWRKALMIWRPLPALLLHA